MSMRAEIGGSGSEKPAKTESNTLRRAPRPHAHALAVGSARSGEFHHRADCRDGECAVCSAKREHIELQRPGVG